MALFMSSVSDVAGGQQRGETGDVDMNEKVMMVRLYRELRLLTDEYNNLLASFHGIFHGLAVTLTTLSVYLFVRSEGMMAALAAYLVMWSIPNYCELMNNYAEIQRGSKTFLESLKASCFVDGSGSPVRTRCGTSRVVGTAIFRRELESFRELRIKRGVSAVYYDTQLVLTMIGIVMNQSLNLLIIT